MNKNFKILALFFIFTLLTSCGVITKNYTPAQLTEEQNNTLYRDQTSKDSSNIKENTLNNFFYDTHLKALIEKGLTNNYDLKNAILQIGEAQASFKQTKLNFFPNLNFAPSVTTGQQSKNSLNFPSNVNINLRTTNVSLGFNTSWEIEVWGKLSALKRNAQAKWFEKESSKNVVQTALVSSIANSYYQLLALDKQLIITENTIKLREQMISTLEALKDSGKSTGADIEQANANLSEAKISKVKLEQQIREKENTLCNLVVIPFQKIERGTINDQQFPVLTVGIPAEMLSNRPDVKASEYQFMQAFELTNHAKASFYPSIQLTSGNAGISALATKTLFDPSSIFFNIAGGLTQPIFNRGQLKANYKKAQLAQEQAWNNFQKTILNAGMEVSNALYGYETTENILLLRNQQLITLEKALEYRTELLNYTSSTNYLDVLTAEQSFVNAQLANTNDQLLSLQYLIDLYLALGGGWQ